MGLAKSSSIVLYSDPSDIRCHLVRCVLAAKNKQVDIVQIEKHELNADLDEQRQVIVDDFLEINPNGHLPSLAYHQLTIIHADIMVEFLDDRFPHPSLFPPGPVERSEARTVMRQIETDWYTLVDKITSDIEVQPSREALKNAFDLIVPLFDNFDYFMSNTYSMVDFYLVVLLWRFESLGIDMSTFPKSMQDYADRMFNKSWFLASLTDQEMDMRCQEYAV
jgi:RNA polymerase-associated protein